MGEIQEKIPKPRMNQTLKDVYVFIKMKKFGSSKKTPVVIYVGHSKTDLRRECYVQSEEKGAGADDCEWCKVRTNDRAKAIEREIKHFYRPENNDDLPEL